VFWWTACCRVVSLSCKAYDMVLRKRSKSIQTIPKRALASILQIRANKGMGSSGETIKLCGIRTCDSANLLQGEFCSNCTCGMCFGGAFASCTALQFQKGQFGTSVLKPMHRGRLGHCFHPAAQNSPSHSTSLLRNQNVPEWARS
jgi:hypothetical protein